MDSKSKNNTNNNNNSNSSNDDSDSEDAGLINRQQVHATHVSSLQKSLSRPPQDFTCEKLVNKSKPLLLFRQIIEPSS